MSEALARYKAMLAQAEATLKPNPWEGLPDDSFDLPDFPYVEPPPAPKCECGAEKALNIAPYSTGHASYCPVAP
jgi:hypothetical protein